MRAVRAAPGRRASSFPSILLFLLALSLCLPSLLAAEAPVENAASSIIASAGELAASGDWDSAEEALAEARLAYPDNSDILYLSALVAQRKGRAAEPSLSWLLAALSSASFVSYAPGEAVNLASALLIRLRRYDEALGLLARPPLAPSSGTRLSARPSGGLDPEYRRLKALAFLGLGLKDEARAELKAAAERFPADPSFPRLFFERFSPVNPKPAERDLADLFLGRLAALSSLDPELPLLALPFMPFPADRKTAILACRAAGVKTRLATLLGLEYGIISDEVAVEEFFSDGSGLPFAELASLKEKIGGPSGLSAFSKALGGFSGSISFDRDGDGIAEESAVYGSGSLLSWSLDSDQDGRTEIAVSCREGLPQSCELRDGKTQADIDYAAYPHASRITFLGKGAEAAFLSEAAVQEEAGEGTSYRFSPEAFVYAPLQLTPFPDAANSCLFLPLPKTVPAPVERAAAASALEMDYREGEILNVVSLDHGIPLRRESFVKGKPFGILDYEKGQARREIRDVDGDGRYETEVSYLAPGKSSGSSRTVVRVDSDGDGVFEYAEADFFPFRKEWDLDGNGSIDVIQLSLSGGGSLRRYSSRLDGHFDEELECDSGGRILSFTREGKPLALVRDENPALTWIGKKPFDLGSGLPSREGVYNYGNFRYRLVIVGSEYFAELAP